MACERFARALAAFVVSEFFVDWVEKAAVYSAAVGLWNPKDLAVISCRAGVDSWIAACLILAMVAMRCGQLRFTRRSSLWKLAPGSVAETGLILVLVAVLTAGCLIGDFWCVDGSGWLEPISVKVEGDEKT